MRRSSALAITATLTLCATARADVGGTSSEDHDEAIDTATTFPWYMPPERPRPVVIDPVPRLLAVSAGFQSFVSGDLSGSALDVRGRVSNGFVGGSIGALRLSGDSGMAGMAGTTSSGQTLFEVALEINRVSGHQIYRGEDVRAYALFPSFEFGSAINGDIYAAYGRIAATGVRVQLCNGYRLDIRGPVVTEWARGAFKGGGSPIQATSVGLEVEIGTSN